MPKQQLSLAPEALLYSGPLTWEQIPRVVDAAMAHGAPEVRLKLLISEQPLTKIVPDSMDTTKCRMSVIQRGTSSVSARLHGRYGRGGTRVIDGRFTAIRHPSQPAVWAILTDASSEFLRRPFRELLRHIHPRPTAPILRTPQLESLLALLQAQSTLSEMRISQVGYRARITSRGASKSVERDRRWTDLSLSEAFSEALEGGQWITDVSASYELHGGKRAYARLSRYAVFTFERHSSTAFLAYMERAVAMATEWYQFLKNRHRTRERLFHSRPFSINFNSPALGSGDQVVLLAKALRSIPKVSCTVLHSNPYLHAVMVDYRDGSTYEILVLSDSGLTVIPQGRATVRSLQRLCSHVFAGFREGSLEEVAYAI